MLNLLLKSIRTMCVFIRTLILIGLALSPIAVDAQPAGTTPDDYQEALVAFKTGKMEQALQLVDALLVKNPLPRGLELKGRILHAQGHYTEAENFYFSALEKDPELVSPHFYLGEAAFKRKAWSESIQYFRVHLGKAKESRDTILKMVYCYIAIGNFSEAARWNTALDPVDEFQPCYYFARAAMALSNGKQKEYTDTLQQARTIYGNDIYNTYEPDLLFLLKSLPKNSPEAAEPTSKSQ
jgi:tetratricopeptide (TPR) repeat protein